MNGYSFKKEDSMKKFLLLCAAIFGVRVGAMHNHDLATNTIKLDVPGPKNTLRNFVEEIEILKSELKKAESDPLCDQPKKAELKKLILQKTGQIFSVNLSEDNKSKSKL